MHEVLDAVLEDIMDLVEGGDVLHIPDAVPCISLSLSSPLRRGAGARGAVDAVLEDIMDLVEGSDAMLRSEDGSVQGSVGWLVHSVLTTCGSACVREQER